jgi:hypothetical protein
MPRTLQLGASVVFENLLPIRGIIEPSQIWLQLAGQDFQRRTLSDTVGAHETQDLAGARQRQTVQFEAVGRVSVGDLGLEVGGQVDDVDGVEGALLGTDTTSYAQAFGDEGDFAGGVDFDAQLAGPHHGAGLFTFLTALLGFAFVRIDDGDTVSDGSGGCYQGTANGEEARGGAPSQFVRHDVAGDDKVDAVRGRSWGGRS